MDRPFWPENGAPRAETADIRAQIHIEDEVDPRQPEHQQKPQDLLAYGPEHIEHRSSGRPLVRQAVLVALMVLTGGLVFVLPEPNGDEFEVSSDTSAEIRLGSADQAAGVQRFGGAESADTESELALAGEEAGRFPDVGTEAAPVAGGVEDWSAGEVAELTAARPAATTAAPTTTTTVAPSTTAAPTVTEPPATTTGDGGADSAAAETTESTTGDGDTATEDTTTEATTEPSTTEPTTGDVATDQTGVTEPAADPAVEADDAAPDSETTVPEAPEAPADTQPPATEAPAPADPAWVDTGNGVLVPPVLLAIRFCESTDNYTAANPRSSARGGYQFLTGSWAAYGHKDRYGVSQAHLATPAQQDEAALITWQRDGTRPWNASRSCWSRRI